MNTVQEKMDIIQDIISLAWEEIANQELANDQGADFPAELNTRNLDELHDLLVKAPVLLDALKYLAENINLKKLNIKKDFSLINAHAQATKLIHELTYVAPPEPPKYAITFFEGRKATVIEHTLPELTKEDDPKDLGGQFEYIYAIQDIIELVEALNVNDTLSFQANRDNKNSHGAICRIQ